MTKKKLKLISFDPMKHITDPNFADAIMADAIASKDKEIIANVERLLAIKPKAPE